MSTLDQIQKRVALSLREQSIELKATASDAVKCIAHLMDHGCTIQQLTVHRDYAVIDIDEPSDWLKGAIKIHRVNGRYRETVLVTKVLNCQVQWVVRERHPLLQREA